jgi:magnesium-transporting ATPase (P-type)
MLCCPVQAITMGMMLAAEPAEADIMNRPPRRPGKRLLGKLILWRCAFVSGLLVILVLGMYGECMKPLLCLRPGADAG